MSLRTRIRGYTLWVNLRLQPTNVTLDNVAVDIMKSFHLRALFESLNGHSYEKLDNFDNLTQQQLITRAERVIEELRKSNLALPDINFDVNMFSMKKFDQIFDVLWCFVVHDIYFTWERAYLFSQENAGTLLQVPFTWYPKEFLKRVEIGFYKRLGAFKHNISVATQEKQFNRLMQDLTAGNTAEKQPEKPKTKRKSTAYRIENPFPEHDFMKQLNPKVAPTMNNYSNTQAKPMHRYGISPSECIVEIVQVILRGSKEGARLSKRFKTLPNLADARVLCAILNWVYPKDGGAVPSELLLQDRVTINLVLRTLERLLQLPESPFCSEDLVECDLRSICAYFCAVLLKAFQFRQFSIVSRKHASLRWQLIEENARVKLFTARVNALLDAKVAAGQVQGQGQEQESDDTWRVSSARSLEINKLKHNIRDAETEAKVIKVTISALEAKFPMKIIHNWMKHADAVVDDLRNTLWYRFESAKYERITLPRPMTLHEFRTATAMNLSLTKNCAFYKLQAPEELMRSRKVLIRRQVKRKTARGFFETQEQWIDNFSGNFEHVELIERLLGFESSRVTAVYIDPAYDFERFSDSSFEIFVDIVSPHKELEENSVIIYQAFQRNVPKLCTEVLFKLLLDRQKEPIERSRSASPVHRNSIRQDRSVETFDLSAFKRVASFIRMRMPQIIVDARHSSVGDSLLHSAAYIGAPCFDLCQFLLECGCSVNATNNLGQTALHKAVDSQSLNVIQLLIEWGSDVNLRDRARCTPFEYARNPQLFEMCSEIYRHYATVVPHIIEHNSVSLLMTLLDQYVQKRRSVASSVRRVSSITPATQPAIISVRSQMLNGSTLLHTAVHFNAFEAVLKTLLLLVEDYRNRNRLHREASCTALLVNDFFSQSITGPCNVLDFQQASALHRAKSPAVANLLLDFNLNLRARDQEGNTVLHLLSAAETLSMCAKLDSMAHRKASRGLSARMKAPAAMDPAVVVRDAELLLATMRTLLEYDISHTNSASASPASASSSRPSSAASRPPPFILVENKLSYTALHCAALKGNTDAARILLQFRPSLVSEIDVLDSSPVSFSAGKTTNAKGKVLRSCLYLTVANDHIDCAQFLKENGFTFKPSRLMRLTVSETDEAEYLVESIIVHRLQCVDTIKTLNFLFCSGANLKAKYGENGDSVLHLTAAHSSIEELEFVFEYLRLDEVDSCCNSRMQTPLHSAVIGHNQKTARFLLERGALPIFVDRSGMMPFDYIEDYSDWLASPVFYRSLDDVETYWRKEMRKAQLRNVKNIVREVSVHVLNNEYESIIGNALGTQRTISVDNNSRPMSRMSSHVAVSRASSATMRGDSVSSCSSPVPSIPAATEREKSELVVAENQRKFLSNLSAKLTQLSRDTRQMNSIITEFSPRLRIRPKSERSRLQRSKQMRTVLQSARAVLPNAKVDLRSPSNVSITRIKSSIN